MHLELAVAVLDVRADGMERDTELAADPLVAGTGREQPQHVGFPRRKHLRPPMFMAGTAPARPCCGARGCGPLTVGLQIAYRRPESGTVAAAAVGGVAWV